MDHYHQNQYRPTAAVSIQATCVYICLHISCQRHMMSYSLQTGKPIETFPMCFWDLIIVSARSFFFVFPLCWFALHGPRLDIILVSEATKQLVLLELTVPRGGQDGGGPKHPVTPGINTDNVSKSVHQGLFLEKFH